MGSLPHSLQPHDVIVGVRSHDEPTKLIAIYNDEPTRLTATVCAGQTTTHSDEKSHDTPGVFSGSYDLPNDEPSQTPLQSAAAPQRHRQPQGSGRAAQKRDLSAEETDWSGDD